MVLIGAGLFGWGAWVGYNTRPRPGPGQTTIIGNPTQSQINHADLAIAVANHGHMTGMGRIKTQDGLQSSGGLAGWNEQTVSFGDGLPPLPGQGCTNSFTVSAALSGDVQTVITDKRTGRQLWAGDSPVSGTVTAVGDGQNVTFDVTFDNGQVFAIDLPEKVPKRFEAGVIGGVSLSGHCFAAEYGLVDVKTVELGPFEISPQVGIMGVQSDRGNDVYVTGGIHGRF